MPHISIINDRALGDEIEGPLAEAWDEVITLVRPHLLSRRIDPLRVVELGFVALGIDEGLQARRGTRPYRR